VSTLKISGFVEVTIVNQRQASVQEIEGLLKVWGVQDGISPAALVGQIELVEVRKPYTLTHYAHIHILGK
jgi:hypothetical protein